MRTLIDSGTGYIRYKPIDWNLVPGKAMFSEVKLKNTDGKETNALKFTYGEIVRKENFDASEEEYVADTIKTYNVVAPDDVIINCLNLNYDFVSQRVAIVREPGVITSAYLVLRPNVHVVPRYLNYFLKACDNMKVFHGMGEGIRQTIKFADIASMSLLCPEKKEQEAIVDFLDSKCAAIEEAIERHKKAIERLEEYKQAFFSYAVTHSDHSNESKNSETYAETIPAHWQEANLGSLVWNMRNGYVGPTRDILVENGVRYIQSLHIKNGKILFERGHFYVSEEWGKEHPKIKTDDLLIVQTGDIGQVAVVTEEYNDCNCHALIIARTRTDLVIPEYLAYYFRSKIGLTELLLTSTGATLQHLNSGLIKFCKVILPPLNEQKKIIDSLHRVDNGISAAQLKHEAIISKLEEYRKSLIYHAVTGKIDCRGEDVS